MGAASKRATRVREADEFNISRLKAELERPKGQEGLVTAWALADIYTAREAQLRGRFALAARMSEAMRTDDAIFSAYQNRLAPQRCVKFGLQPAKGARGLAIANEGEGLFGTSGIGISAAARADIHGYLVEHGVAFGQCIARPRADGSRIDYELKAWPIEFVRWDPLFRVFVTQVNPETVPANEVSAGATTSAGLVYPFPGGYEVPIIHGDGRWIVFKKHEIYPWRQDACVLAAALVWARHAFANRDWAKGSVAHGNAKIVGELPTGVALQAADKNGNVGLTEEAAAFLELLRSIASADTPIGIRPAGAKTEMLVNMSSAWQVWNELVLNAERAAARIYLGTDGTLGAQGGAPGVDIGALFGVAATKVSGDLEAIEEGINTGLIEPWCAMNFGDSSLAPKFKYELPNADEEARSASIGARRTAFYADIASARAQGMNVTQDYVDSVAEDFDIDPPQLDERAATGPNTNLTTKDVAGVVITVNEARASAGLPPLAKPDGTVDPRGFMTVGEFNAAAIAKTDVSSLPAGASDPGGAPGGAPSGPAGGLAS